MDLKKYKLGDIADIIPGYAFKSTDFLSGENIVIKIKDIEPPFIDVNNADKVGFRPNDKYRLEYGDFVLAMTGATIGKVGVNNTHIPNVYINQRVCKFIPNEGLCDKNYLYYLLNTDAFRNFIYKNIDSASAQPNIGHPSILKFEHYFPNIEEQKRIGNLLSSLDQKIALNRKINDNLEAMAKQLYDYWFVQFDFPNEEGKPYKSSGGKMVWNDKLKREIPEGWSAKSIFDEMSIQYGFPFSTDDFTEEVTNIPVVRIRDILDNTISVYSHEETDDKYRLNEADLLIGMDGNFHMNYWINNIAYLNQRSVRLRSKQNSNVSIVQARYDIEPYIKAKEQRAKGSTVGHLSDKDLKELKVMICPNRGMRDALDSLLYRIIANRKENLSLTKQRDELLPLLMNGQVSVNYHLSKNLELIKVALKNGF